jgi:hypothetical protein
MDRMKHIGFLAITILFSFSQIQAQSKKAKQDMVFDKTVDGMTYHDFGSIVTGANGNVDFIYTNKGSRPLIIADVKSSCGCTVPSWTKDPVAPGKQGTLKVKYNTQLPGVFNKTVEVYSNANNSPVRITIMGKVTEQPGAVKQDKSSLTAVTSEEGQLNKDVNDRVNAGPSPKSMKGSEKKLLQGQKGTEPSTSGNLLEPVKNPPKK